MPKQRITKEMIIQAAFETARTDGMEQVLVKSIADKIGCSVQPIYSYCNNMEGLRTEVVKQVRLFLQNYLSAHIDKNDLFRSTGRAYLQFAKEEPHLFKIFVLHQRTGVSSLNDLYRTEANPHIAEFIADTLHIGLSQAKQLHLNMLIYTIGIGTVLSVTTPGISTEDIYMQQESAFEAFLNQSINTEVNRKINQDSTN